MPEKYFSRQTFYSPAFLLSIIFFLIFFIFISATHAREKNIIATGMADGISAQSRDIALNDALRQAVAQGMGSFVSSETLVENMILIEDRIYSESRGYIKSYKVLKETTADDTYKVKISAVVKLDKLVSDLESIGLIMKKKQNPRVMVILYSRQAGDGYWGITYEGSRFVENQIESALMRKKFQIVDAQQVKSKKEMESFLAGSNYLRASKVAKDFGAEVFVTGEVKRSYVDTRRLFGMDVRFFTNEVRLKALETDTAKILFSGYKMRPPSGSDAMQPLEEASSELIEEMAAGILDQWSRDVYQAGSYRLSLSEVSFKELSQLKKGLKKVRGVGDIKVRSFNSGIALIDVKYKGSLEELADGISEITAPAVEVTGLQANTIELKIGK